MVRRITLTNNRTLDGTQALLNSKNIKDGIDATLVASESEPSDYDERKDEILPGAQQGKFSRRKNLFRVQAREIALSTTGKLCAVATTEGFNIYSLGDFLSSSDNKYIFNVSKKDLVNMARQGDYLSLITAGLHLKDNRLLGLTFSKVPPEQIDLLVQTLPTSLAMSLVSYIAHELENSQSVEYLLLWLKPLLLFHADNLSRGDLDTVSVLKNANKTLKRRIDAISEIGMECKYYGEFIMAQNAVKEKMRTEGVEGAEGEE
jgi:hypothetical protein